MPYVEQEDYNEIRRNVDAGANDKTLPDTDIDGSTRLQLAERNVAAQLSGLSLTTEQQARAKLAVIFLTAAYITRTYPYIVSKSEGQGTGSSWTKKQDSPEVKASRLESMADAEIAAIKGSQEIASSPRSTSTRVSVVW